jgi:hypothetical protein
MARTSRATRSGSRISRRVTIPTQRLGAPCNVGRSEPGDPVTMDEAVWDAQMVDGGITIATR